MKDSINKIYSAIVNYMIDFFHIAQKKCTRKIKRIKRKLRKFYYYEILGVIVVSVYFYRFLEDVYNLRFLKNFRSKSKLYLWKFTNCCHEYYKAYKKYLENAN